VKRETDAPDERALPNLRVHLLLRIRIPHNLYPRLSFFPRAIDTPLPIHRFLQRINPHSGPAAQPDRGAHPERDPHLPEALQERLAHFALQRLRERRDERDDGVGELLAGSEGFLLP
jgi:hypothetical protein